MGEGCGRKGMRGVWERPRDLLPGLECGCHLWIIRTKLDVVWNHSCYFLAIPIAYGKL